jgi:hypothetical protein
LGSTIDALPGLGICRLSWSQDASRAREKHR